MPHAQFVLFDGFDPLDVIAPYEVLTAGSDFLGGALDLELVTAEGPRLVPSGTPGIALAATSTLDPTLPGYIVVPGAAGPADAIPELLARFGTTDAIPLLREALTNPALTVTSVCGGGLALALAGLLEGRTATTHVLGLNQLAACGVNAVRARVVDDGNLITAAGVTTGLDLGLYLLERDFSPQAARAVEDLFEHERRGTTWKAAA